MATQALFLHVTDAHIGMSGTPFGRHDIKAQIPGIRQPTREEVLDLALARLGQRLAAEGCTLDGVLFSGDALDRGRAGGHERLLEMLLERLRHCGVVPERIIATPGNHDMPRTSLPGSEERYAAFRDVWGKAGCILPWLDGIDAVPPSPDRHRLLSSDLRWAVFPINTSNWSHVTSILPKPLADVWSHIPDLLPEKDAEGREELRRQLEALVRYDMARVSHDQLEALRAIVAATPQPSDGKQLRIAVMHHHLRAPSLREEVKAFEGISNLEQIRTFLRDSGFAVVVHGHKHEHAIRFETVEGTKDGSGHRVLVLSGATFEPGRENDAARLVTLTGLPNVPQVEVEPLALPHPGAATPRMVSETQRLWTAQPTAGSPVVLAADVPVVIHGSDLDEVYERACRSAETDAERGIVIVHLDLPADDPRLPLPSSYPLPSEFDEPRRQAWIRDLAGWWQIERSQLEHRIPYIHGTRLRRYGGKIDQINRIIKLLKHKPSTRAVAVLVDPFRDFDPSGDPGAGGRRGRKEDFASFCLVEFRRRNVQPGRPQVDAIAFYRAQEFARWWPINIAELRILQLEIAEALGGQPGRITTIAADARTISRSPTQVAMPIIDRWLDQAPEMLHLLASALLTGSATGEGRSAALRDWEQTLSDLHDSTCGYYPDGVPVAIEGLRMLGSFIEAAAGSDDQAAKDFSRLLNDLAARNASYEASPREKSDFVLWSPTAARLVADLRKGTALLMAHPKPDGR
ncbi:metallophosphoesterase [Methylorubrum thiocyanatum]|uniref:metallophosphoesterase n=1 Tax=Methylorubrum thiocyanatum TaxID=47958 RepID=UPI00383A8924